MRASRLVIALALLCFVGASAAAKDVAQGKWRRQMEMVPMRDGVRLSTYITFPEGEGRIRSC